MPSPILHAVISAKIRERQILNCIKLDLFSGTPVIILGESGVGKTTLLRALCGWPSQEVEFFGHLLFREGTQASFPLSESAYSDLRRRVHFLPQDFDCLCPTVSIFGHLRQMNFAKGIHKNQLLSFAVDHILPFWPNCNVGLLMKYPGQFSGGQVRRLALAILLLAESEVLLLDEPTNGLDDDRRYEVANILNQLSSQKALAVVTHDLALASMISGDVVVLSGGNVVEQTPVPQFFLSPQSAAGTVMIERWQALRR